MSPFPCCAQANQTSPTGLSGVAPPGPAIPVMARLKRYKSLDYEFPTTTLVWQLTGAGFENLRLEEIPRPRPGPEDIAFRVDSNSVCFSDIKVVRAGGGHPRLRGRKEWTS